MDLDVIHEAADICGMKLEWRSFDPDDVSHLIRLIGSIQGDVYVVGDAIPDHHLRVFQYPYGEIENVRYEIELGHFDAVLIGVTDPVIGAVHHDALCTVTRCPPPRGLPEDPRELERHLLEQLEQRRKRALEQMPPPVRRGLLAILERDNSYIPAIKYIRTAMMCSLADAASMAKVIKPWWPGGVPAPTSHRITEMRLPGEES